MVYTRLMVNQSHEDEKMSNTSRKEMAVITNIELSAAATERFNVWFADVAKPDVRMDVVVSELLDVFQDRLSDGESLSYELSPMHTTSGRPEIFRADRDDLEIEESDE